MAKVLVTGGSGAIGSAVCAAFAKNGHKVFFTYMTNADGAKRLSEQTGGMGIRCDVSSLDEARSLYVCTGGVDILVNNAGIAQQKLFCDITEDEWDKMFAVNTKSVYNMCSVYTPFMIRQKSGCIINISSMWGVSGASCEVHYSASKAAVIGFTKALAKELGLSGIRVNCVAPGVIESPMNGMLTESDIAELAEQTPAGRIGTPDDVAAAVTWLASDGAAFVTGQTVTVDGGFTL